MPRFDVYRLDEDRAVRWYATLGGDDQPDVRHQLMRRLAADEFARMSIRPVSETWGLPGLVVGEPSQRPAWT